MSQTEEKVYRQTYSLDEDESDSETSEEVHYIQASELPADELERILATYKTPLEPETGEQYAKHSFQVDGDGYGSKEDQENFTTVPTPSWLRVAYDDEDTNEETKPKTIVYKTTYKTSNEEQSCSEASNDEDLNEDSDSDGISYKTVYRTFRTQDSSPEVCNDDDPDYEPKEERIKRHKKKQKLAKEMKLFAEAAHSNGINQEQKAKEVTGYKKTVVLSTEKQSSPKVLFSGEANEEPNAESSIRKMKNCVELQQTPGDEIIIIPIPVCNQQKFKHTYKEEWENEPQFKDWIQPWLDDSMYAYCKFCKCKLIAHKKSLRDHSNTKKHRKNVYDAMGASDGSNSEPANLTYLIPRARRRTEEILLTNYDGSSLTFANSSEFNVRTINDPLLPIS